MEPLISICIPAYKQPEMFERCVKSVLSQDYNNIEIIVSDDTPDDSVKIIADKYKNHLALRYMQNIPSLGSPANWNNAMDKANGEYVMLLHHDDSLANSSSLTTYIKAFTENPDVEVVYSKAVSINEEGKQSTLEHHPSIISNIYNNPVNLILGNLIGPPSLLMFKNNIQTRYDLRYKWLVDIEYYIRLLLDKRKFYFIDQHLVTIGVHAEQTTQYCLNDAAVILKENISLLNQFKHLASGNIKIYDYYWRLLRNHDIRNNKQLLELGITNDVIPYMIKRMISFQNHVPSSMLKVGFVSKILMGISYFRDRGIKQT